MAERGAQDTPDTNLGDLIFDWNTRNRRGPLSPLKRHTLSFFDETLRDGIQSPSVRDPSIEEKQEILRLTASLGIDAVDLGLPGAGARAVRDVTALVEYAQREKLGIEFACAGTAARMTSTRSPTLRPDRRADHRLRIPGQQPDPTLRRELARRPAAPAHHHGRRAVPQARSPDDLRHRGHHPHAPRDPRQALPGRGRPRRHAALPVRHRRARHTPRA